MKKLLPAGSSKDPVFVHLGSILNAGNIVVGNDNVFAHQTREALRTIGSAICGRASEELDMTNRRVLFMETEELNTFYFQKILKRIVRSTYKKPIRRRRVANENP